MKRFKISTAVLVLSLISINFAFAGNGKVYANKNNVAIDGYDCVAYFTENAAVKGNEKHSTEHNGVKYYFKSEENKNAFKKSPDKYLPQYGGWCAFAMGAKNAKVPSNPDTFKLYNGKLYLFFNDDYKGKKFNTIIPWNSDEAKMKKAADANWSKTN